jgi:hypothetical protein
VIPSGTFSSIRILPNIHLETALRQLPENNGDENPACQANNSPENGTSRHSVGPNPRHKLVIPFCFTRFEILSAVFLYVGRSSPGPGSACSLVRNNSIGEMTVADIVLAIHPAMNGVGVRYGCDVEVGTLTFKAVDWGKIAGDVDKGCGV